MYEQFDPGRVPLGSDLNFEIITIVDRAQILENQLTQFIRAPNQGAAEYIYELLSEFSTYFKSVSLFKRIVILSNPKVINMELLGDCLAQVREFIANPRAPKFQLKDEHYGELGTIHAHTFPVDFASTSYLDAMLLEDLLTSYVLNADKMEPCAHRDWPASEGAASVNKNDFRTHALQFEQRAKISDPTYSIQNWETTKSLIKNYCLQQGLSEAQRDFVITHANQNGALGLLLSAIGGLFFEQCQKWNGNCSLNIFPKQNEGRVAIEGQAGRSLKMSYDTDYNLMNMTNGATTLLSKLRLTIEIRNHDWRMFTKGGNHYVKPGTAEITFEYSQPTPEARARYPQICDLLLQTWRYSSTRFATVRQLV